MKVAERLLRRRRDQWDWDGEENQERVEGG
jgi:hypothetical protein